MTFKVKKIEDLELVYSILREHHPQKQIDITFNWNTKEYTIQVSNNQYKYDPEVPLDLNIEVIYGDSVTGDTPLLLNKHGEIYIETIESIFNNDKKIEYSEFKIFDKSIRLEKEYSSTDFQVWSDIGWVDIKKVIRHKCNKKIYRILTRTGCVDVTEDHSLILQNMKEIKPEQLKIGDVLLHNFPIRYINKNISSFENDREWSHTFSDKLLAQRAFYNYVSSGLNVGIKIEDSQFILEKNSCSDCLDNKRVISIQYLEKTEYTNEFVYDLETSTGRFNAGIGELTIHNTDSIFINFKYNREDFESNRRDTFKLATIAGDKLTNEIFKRPPIEMEFEKVFQPFVLLTKKRYIGKKFENPKDPFQLKTIDSKGIALTRRDYCKLVKDCYKSIIDVIMENGNQSENTDHDTLERSIHVFKKFCDKIDKYEADDQDLGISAMLAKEYSCGLCKKKTEWSGIRCECKYLNSHLDNYCGKCKSTLTCKHVFSLAHVNLAVNLLKRREDVQVNDRIQYIFVEGTDPKQKKGELAEDPIWAKRLGLKFNRLCYLEQLAKPLLGLYKVLLQDDPERLDDLIEWVNQRIERYGGKRLKPSDFKIDE